MADDEHKNEAFLKSVSECCKNISNIKKTDVISRRNALKEIHNIIVASDPILFKEHEVDSLLESLVKHLIDILSKDDSEKCRELSLATLKIIINRISLSEICLSFLFEKLTNCLGKTDERECSEEIRLMEIEFFSQLIENIDCSLLRYLNNISTILKACIIDNCSEIKRKSCECLPLLASKEAANFHMIASTFLRPLLLTISHQHMKTRALCIKAIGSIVDYLNSDEIELTLSHLSQRLFDHSPSVRQAVTTVLGEMLLQLKDRYSYFHRLIPLMLSTLYDDVKEIRSQGKNLWSCAGSQYLQENEKDYKDLIDFPTPKPKNYPEYEERPSLGCRILVQRNIYKIFPPLVRELSDWSKDTRLKCSKVLFSLIVHAEEKITIQLTSAVEGISVISKDDSKECIEWALKSAEMMGYFVDPNLLCDTIMTLIHQSPSAAHLSIFGACLRGYKSTYLDECFQEICKFLSSPAISRLKQGDEQANVLLCIEALLSSGNTIDINISENIFIVLCSVSGLAAVKEILDKAEDLLERLAEMQSLSVTSLYEKHALNLIKSLTSDYELWNPQTTEMLIFCYMIKSGYLNGDIVEIMFPVLTNNLHPSKDAKLRSHILTVLVPVLQTLLSSQYKYLSEKFISLIRTGIFPNLTWSAGQTASKLRVLAAASLFEVIHVSHQSSTDDYLLKPLSEEMLPILKTLTEDEEVATRILACKMFELTLPKINDSLDELKIHNTCFEILHCMDDESDEVRIMTVRVLKAYVKSFPVDYNWNLYKSHLKHIYENVLVHMDDKNEKIRLSVLDLLKEIGYAAPDVLLDEVESKRYVMTANDLCDNLIEHIKKIKV